MTSTSAPERLRWTVESLDVRPTDRVLEIGCGRGLAASLVCERLTTGHLTAIDRSAKMIAAAEQRNRDHIAAGTAVFRTVSLADLESRGEVFDAIFDKVFAVNVNLFWLRPISHELDVVKRLLAPAGALYLSYEPPGARAAEITDRVVAGLAPNGFATTTLTSTAATGAALLCVVARPA